MNKQTLAIIIPCYNEEANIEACLQSIAAQSDIPDEVIVVDNNCTDNTVNIAMKFDFVRIVKESAQGITHARNTGFNAASGDLLGRIDAEAVLSKDWVKTAKCNFSRNQNLSGLTGLAITSRLPYTLWFKTTIGSRLYLLWAKSFFGVSVMWGSNMVITRKIWKDALLKTCNDDNLVHEDQDLSLCIWELGGEISQDNSLLESLNGSTYFDFKKQINYWVRAHRTKKLHNDFLSSSGYLNDRNLVSFVLTKLCTPFIWIVVLMFGILTSIFHFFKAVNKK